MDSKIVTREIRREIWPALRDHGFRQFAGRTFWRHTADRVWVVAMPSFKSYFASVDGCTTFSFAISLGIWIRCLSEGPQTPPARPKYADCHLRRSLSKTIHQEGYPRKDIWLVTREGENLLDALADARAVITTKGQEWFRQFDDDQEVLRTLIEEEESDALHGIGARWSTARKTLLGRCAISTGHKELGARVLREAEAERESIRLAFETIGRNSPRAPHHS